MYSCVCICSYLWKCLLIHISVFPRLLSVFLWMYIQCICICEYMYVYKQVKICAEREWGCDAHAGCRSGHLQFQPTWHPLPQYGFGEHSFHHDRDAFVTKDAHLFRAKGRAPSPSPRLSPQNWNPKQKNNKGWNSPNWLCPKEQSPSPTAWIPKVQAPGHLVRATQEEIDTHENIYTLSQLQSSMIQELFNSLTNTTHDNSFAWDYF